MQRLAAEKQDVLVRVSTGSALILGLASGLLNVGPTTLYLLTYHPRRCSANCVFCSQAKTNRSKEDLLSRVTWPVFRLEEVLNALTMKRGHVRRVCIQAVNYANVVDGIVAIASHILSRISIDISVSCQPVDSGALHRLRHVGVDRISIPVDAVNPKLFDTLKGHAAGGPYSWQGHMNALRQAVSVFGAGRVTTHVIVGLGEIDRDVLEFIQEMADLGICPALFAFTPIPGTRLENRDPPPISRYRLLQTARYIIVNGLARSEDMKFDASEALVDLGVSREELRHVIESGLPYLTSGCPNCNRPFYNEKPSGPLYNFPRPLNPSEIEEIERTVRESCRD